MTNFHVIHCAPLFFFMKLRCAPLVRSDALPGTARQASRSLLPCSLANASALLALQHRLMRRPAELNVAAEKLYAAASWACFSGRQA